MNRLADAMVPYLVSNGIQYVRNSPDMSAASSIRQANAGWYDFYLALHSNAAGEGNYGNVRGIIAFYYPSSLNGKRAAEIFAENLRQIYPLPDRVRTQATTTLGEVSRSVSRPCCWKSAIMTIMRTLSGLKTTSHRLRRIWCCR